jgi:hypothetical protein
MRPVVALAALLVTAGSARSSNDVVLNVAQPLVGYDFGLIIGFEAYAGYLAEWPAGLVTLTCAENSTRVLGVGRGVSTEDRNAASVVGLSLRHVPKTALVPGVSEYKPYFGDTLRVVLEIPAYAVELERARQHGWRDVVLASLREVVCATLECARINAASQPTGDRYPDLRYLAVEIEGWDRLADLAGTYSLQGIAPISDRQRRWYEGARPNEGVCR